MARFAKCPGCGYTQPKHENGKFILHQRENGARCPAKTENDFWCFCCDKYHTPCEDTSGCNCCQMEEQSENYYRPKEDTK